MMSHNADLEHGEDQNPHSSSPTPQTGPHSFNPHDLPKRVATFWRESSIFVKLHICVGSAVVFILLMVYEYALAGYQWWMLLPFIFAMTLYFHVNFVFPSLTPEFWNLVFVETILLDAVMLLADCLRTNLVPGYIRGGYWFWCIWGISAMFLVALRYKIFADFSISLLALYQYCILNAMFFIGWFQSASDNPADLNVFPWFFFPLFLLAIPLITLYVRFNYNEYRVWVHSSIAAVIINIMLFFVWGFVDSKWPWFLLPWLITGAVLLGLWRYYRGFEYDQVGGASQPNFPAYGQETPGYAQQPQYQPSPIPSGYEQL